MYPNFLERAEEQFCTCGAGHGSHEGHVRDWCWWVKVKPFIEALDEANGLCRSFSEIAKRKGIETNWAGFSAAVNASLKKQHKVMYPRRLRKLTRGRR